MSRLARSRRPAAPAYKTPGPEARIAAARRATAAGASGVGTSDKDKSRTLLIVEAMGGYFAAAGASATAASAVKERNVSVS